MQFKKKTINKEETKNEPSVVTESAIPETVTDDDLSLSDDVSSFVSDDDVSLSSNDDVGTSFVAPELETSDFEPIEDDSSGWSSVDTELESKEDYYIDDTEYDSASYNAEIPVPPMLDDEEIVEHIVDDGEIVEEKKEATEVVAKENKSMSNKKTSLRERLETINEKNDSILESLEEALVQAAETQNCTSCVVTVDRVVTEGDFVMNYLNANCLDVINVEANSKESKLTISWSWD